MSPDLRPIVDTDQSRADQPRVGNLVRELDERLGFSDLIVQHIADPRGKNTQFPLTDLVRQSIYRRLAGYEDVNDAERLSQDPTFRLIGSEKIRERGAALPSRVHSFETELLTQAENLTGLWAINRELIARTETLVPSRRVVLDLDGTEIPVYGQQELSAYNGHFESTCYHPLLLFNRQGGPDGESGVSALDERSAGVKSEISDKRPQARVWRGTRMLAQWLVGLIAIGIIFVGVRFLLNPSAGADAFGVPVPPSGAYAYLRAKGTRDLVSGLFVFALMSFAYYRPLAVFIGTATLIPLGDFLTVLAYARRGPRTALYIHGGTALYMAAVAVLLWRTAPA